jgi:hypothetical protein
VDEEREKMRDGLSEVSGWLREEKKSGGEEYA